MLSKVYVALHGLKSFLRLVPISLQEKEQTLLFEELSVVLDLIFGRILIELFDLFAFILVMLDLPKVEKARALLALLSFLFLLCIA